MKIIEKIEVSLTKEAQEIIVYLAGSMFEDNPDIRKACAHCVFEFLANHDLSPEVKRVMIEIAGIGITVEDREERKKMVADILKPIFAKKYDELIAKDPDDECFNKIERGFKNFLNNVEVNIDEDILDSLKANEEDIPEE